MLSDNSGSPSSGDGDQPPTVAWVGDAVGILDQTELPGAGVALYCPTVDESVIGATQRA